MKKYKDDNEAAKKYADLLIKNVDNNERKLQHEAACLDFAAGANWKDEQLRLSIVSSSFLNLIYGVANNNTKEDFIEYFKAELENYC